jgi:hypothetical protein
MIDMARMLARGAASSMLFCTKDQLRRALVDLGVGHAFDAATIDRLYERLGQIIGSFDEERKRPEVAKVAKSLLATANRLSEISKILSGLGLEARLRDAVEISVASEITILLALDPAVGSLSKAYDTISAFQREAARMAQVCTIAHAALPDQPGERGRPPNDWYDDFTALLLEIAKRGGVKPTLRKDRKTKVRSGWLLDAAQSLEAFLDCKLKGKRVFSYLMRSPSLEACGKRLERSRKRLRNAKRQNSLAR